MHSNPPRADQLAGPAALPTSCHAEQLKHAETQFTEPGVMLEPCRSESRALASRGLRGARRIAVCAWRGRQVAS